MWIYRKISDNTIVSIAENDVLNMDALLFSKEELAETSLDEFAGRCLLTTTTPRLQVSDYDAPDIHEAIVQVQSNIPELSSINISVNGDSQVVSLVGGVGQLEPISSEVIENIKIQPVDGVNYWARLEIEVYDE